jgi:flagellar hook-basal body complex protein FliE
MATPAAAAAGAYANLARLTDGIGGLAKAGRGDGADSGFGALVKQAMTSVVDAGHKADAQSHAAVTGKANIVDVVTAVSESEVAVDALVSVRDRVIQAYEDILKMPI